MKDMLSVDDAVDGSSNGNSMDMNGTGILSSKSSLGNVTTTTAQFKRNFSEIMMQGTTSGSGAKGDDGDEDDLYNLDIDWKRSKHKH